MKLKVMSINDTHKPWIIIIIIILFISAVSASTDLISDGSSSSSSSLFSGAGETCCEQSYGFLPCSTTILGNAFLILVYGYFMYTAGAYLSNGSELLLEIMGPGIIGGLFLPILGALPDSILILVSGISGTPETAQDQVSVGMGLLAGSTVMLLTVIWGTCVLVGKCDLVNSRAIDETDTKGFSIHGSGVSTYIWTSYAARIMAISVLPFLVVQLAQALNSSSGRHMAFLLGLILSLVMLISYFVYQVFQPWIQMRRLDYVKHKRVMTGFLRHLKKHAVGSLCNRDGTLNRDVIIRVFKQIDHDNSQNLSRKELAAFVVGLNIEGMNMSNDDIVEKVMKEFDTEREDDLIDLDEFTKGISKLLSLIRGGKVSHHNADTSKALHTYDQEAETEHFLLGESGEEAGEEIEDIKATTIKAILFLVLGTIIAAVFADPLVDAVDNFSDATSIPSFFVSFIVLPLAISSEAVSAIIFASRKKRKSASLTFCELYGGVTMNNVLCLSVFLALVFFRGLSWDFSAEVLVIVLVCVVMGALGSFHTTFPLWTTFVAFLLYPASLVLVYVLD